MKGWGRRKFEGVKLQTQFSWWFGFVLFIFCCCCFFFSPHSFPKLGTLFNKSMKVALVPCHPSSSPRFVGSFDLLYFCSVLPTPILKVHSVKKQREWNLLSSHGCCSAVSWTLVWNLLFFSFWHSESYFSYIVYCKNVIQLYVPYWLQQIKFENQGEGTTEFVIFKGMFRLYHSSQCVLVVAARKVESVLSLMLVYVSSPSSDYQVLLAHTTKRLFSFKLPVETLLGLL